MFAYFKNYLLDKITFSDDELEVVRSVSSPKNLRKRQDLLHEGEVWRYNAFMRTGLVKTFSIDDTGDEHIMNFSPENYWAGEREILLTGQPSAFNIVVLEH